MREAKQRIRPLFAQDRVAISAGQFIDGLLGNEPRKTGWMRAAAAGDQASWRQRAILGRRRWDADALRDIARERALETFCDEHAVLVIDETGFLKQGKASCGVVRQYTARQARLPIARLAYSLAMCRGMVMRSSALRSTCQRNGRTIAFA
ncbi:transposase [Bradyrhizobium sp. 23]|nr:transposase [Bradyrhizobium sp. 23]